MSISSIHQVAQAPIRENNSCLFSSRMVCYYVRPVKYFPAFRMNVMPVLRLSKTLHKLAADDM